jgi:hypothetical protein
MEPAPHTNGSALARGLPGPRGARFASVVLLGVALVALASDRLLGPPPERYPTSDHAVLELCVRLAAEGSQRLGPEARFHFQHPGPSFFYFAVPFYEALGRGAASLGVAALVWNTVALLAFVRGASRLAPPAGGLIAGLLALAVLQARGIGVLLSYWNANLPILPFAATLVASARLAMGDRRALPLVALFGSLAVQTHAVYLVPVGLVAGAGLALLALPRLRERLGVPSTNGSAWSAPLLASAALVALLWALPVWDELSGDYHNLRRMLGTGGNPRANPWPEAVAAASRALLGFAGVRWEGGTPALWSGPLLLAAALLAAFVWAAGSAARRRSPLAALALSSSAALAAVLLTARVAPGALVFPYVLHWAPVAGASAALVVAAEALERRPRARALVLSAPGRAALVALSALLCAEQALGARQRAAEPRDEASVRVEQASHDVRQQLDVAWRGLAPAARPRFLLRLGSGVDRDAALGLILALDKARLRFGVRPFGAYRLDGRLRPDGTEQGELVLGDAPGGMPALRLTRVEGLQACWTMPARGPASSAAP